uniref:Chaperone DnaJ n=1 Tax=Hirondellea gigas TaxID=1518452 RepID=A0A6A7G9L2_9CRUS
MIGSIIFFALMCEALSVRETKFYDLLGVPTTATPRQLKKAYKDLALKHHPDQGGDENKFVEISNAYQVLSDTDQRRTYDRSGEEGLKKKKGQSGHNPFDFFRQFTGGRQQPGDQDGRGADIEMELQATLEHLYNGHILEVHVRNQMICTKCFGSGAKSDAHVHQCHRCGGSGVIMQETRLAPNFVTRSQTTCDVCHGKGTIVKVKCPHCGGKKLITGDKTLTVDIERGMPDGEEIVFEHEADESPDHDAGHIIFRIVTFQHERFERRNDDLHFYAVVSLKQALVGFTMTIQQLDGRDIILKRDEITKPDEIVKIKGEGMPHHDYASSTGDLFVHFKVDFPKSLTSSQKQQVEQLGI